VNFLGNEFNLSNLIGWPLAALREGQLLADYYPSPRAEKGPNGRFFMERSLIQCSGQKHWHQARAFGSTVLYIGQWKQLK
jgi:hypothetical protein